MLTTCFRVQRDDNGRYAEILSEDLLSKVKTTIFACQVVKLWLWLRPTTDWSGRQNRIHETVVGAKDKLCQLQLTTAKQIDWMDWFLVHPKKCESHENIRFNGIHDTEGVGKVLPLGKFPVARVVTLRQQLRTPTQWKPMKTAKGQMRTIWLASNGGSAF